MVDAGDASHRLVLVHATTEVALPAAALVRRLGDARQWLAPLAEAAEAEGGRAVVRVGPSARRELLGRRVRATILGTLHGRNDTVVAWLRWEAVDHHALFPVLEGELELSPVDGARSRLSLVGSYVPPLGALGERLDRAVLHRVADRTVRTFVERLARGLETWAPVEISLPASVDSPAAARRFVDSLGGEVVAGVDRDVLRLLVNELVTGAVRSRSAVRVRLIPLADGVIGEVTDADPTVPTPAVKAPGGDAHTVYFVDLLADGWGVAPAADGKTVWFRLAHAA